MFWPSIVHSSTKCWEKWKALRTKNILGVSARRIVWCWQYFIYITLYSFLLHLVVYNYRKTSDGYLYFSIEYFKFGDEATLLDKDQFNGRFSRTQQIPHIYCFCTRCFTSDDNLTLSCNFMHPIHIFSIFKPKMCPYSIRFAIKLFQWKLSSCLFLRLLLKDHLMISHCLPRLFAFQDWFQSCQHLKWTVSIIRILVFLILAIMATSL